MMVSKMQYMSSLITHMNDTEWYWGEPEVRRIELIARRIINDTFHGLQPADLNDVISECVCLALSVHFDSPESYGLNFHFINLCVKTAGIRLGLLARRNQTLPKFISLSEASTIKVEFPDIDLETPTADIIDLMDWKNSTRGISSRLSG